MSGTLSMTSSTSISALLDNLNQQQEQVPADQRGLAKELENLRTQLEANPALESDHAYLTQVAWLVQDWSKFSGTNQTPALSPVLQAGLQQMSNHYPGLENNDLHQLLAHTPDMHDQRLVSDIRSTAMEVASMSPETQAATLVGMATANLVNRVMEAGTQLEVEAPPPSQNSPEPSTQGPRTQQEQVHSEDNPGQGNKTLSEQEDHNLRDKDANKAREAEEEEPVIDTHPTPPQRGDEQKGQEHSRPQAANKQSSEQQAQPVQQGSAPAPSGPVSPSQGSLMSQTAGRFASWTGGMQAKADARRIDKLVRDIDANITQTRAYHQGLKEKAAPFFEKLENTARQENTTVQAILMETGPGGKHEALGQEFYKERNNNPEVRKVYENLTGSLSDMAKNILSLRSEASQRNASEDPAVKMAEQRAGAVGLEVESVPGLEPGKTLIQSIGDVVEKLVQKTKVFLGLDNDRNPPSRD
ncbi:hypothetical protein [Acetobacter sp.]|uniref:hypothetical protein n=1 Tax=Acetobacter sp. TaxID=440 RepID=UPI0039E7B3D2